MRPAFPYRTATGTAPVTKDLTITDTVFAELGITDPTSEQETQMEKYIHQASALIAGHIGRDIAQDAVVDHFLEDENTSYLRLSMRPATAIASIVEDGTTLDSSEYELGERDGKVWRLSGGERHYWPADVQIAVTYTGGFELLETLPDDIERACIDQVKAKWFEGQRGDPTVRSFNIPDVLQETYSVAGGDMYGSSGLLKTVEAALTTYVTIAI